MVTVDFHPVHQTFEIINRKLMEVRLAQTRIIFMELNQNLKECMVFRLLDIKNKMLNVRKMSEEGIIII